MKKLEKLIPIFVICILFLVVLGLGITWKNKGKEEKKEKEPLKADTVLKDVKSVSVCYDENHCPRPVADIYGTIETKIKNDEVQKWIQNQNDITKRHYQEVQDSTTESAACSEVKDIYKHSIRHQNIYNIVEKENYMVISIKRLKEDLCTQEGTDNTIEVLIYNKNTKKVISQKDWMQELNVTDEEVGVAIENNVNSLNENSSSQSSFQNAYQKGVQTYILYYDQDGKLLASYFQPEEKLYFSAIVRER